ncbi:hypothetical protein H0H92_005296 [Tricholoma furcatifolium]|nr:hypothetical protein H0H92_005296 [Tricholoma furcatifolium]
MATEVPQYVYGNVLPHDTLNVLELLKFSTPKTAPGTLSTLDSPDIFSQAASLIDTATSARALLGLTMPCLPDVIHLEQRAEEAARSGYISFMYAVDGRQMRMSFWVIGFWKAAHEVTVAKEQWTAAKAWLEGCTNGRGILEGLTRLPWKYTLSREIGGDIHGLAMLATNKWLGTTQMAQISAVINSDLEDKLGSTDHSLGQEFTDKLLLVYRYFRNTYLTDNSCQFMHEIADKINSSKWTRLSLFVSVHVNGTEARLPCGETLMGNHWVAVIINSRKKKVMYSDSLGLEPPSELIEALRWWLSISKIEGEFGYERLPCGQQVDNFSCSILAANAVQAAFFSEIDLLNNGEDALDARVEMLGSIIALIHKTELKMDVTSTNIIPPSTVIVNQGFIPIATDWDFHPTKYNPKSKRPAEDTVSRVNAKRTKPHRGSKTIPMVKTENIPTNGNIADPSSLYPLFLPAQSKLVVDSVKTRESETTSKVQTVASDDDNLWEDEENISGDEEDDTAEYVEPKDLIDVVKPFKKVTGREKSKGGRPRSALIDRLLVECYQVSNPSKHIHRCVAAECGATWVSRSLQRVLRHQRTCSYISKDLRQEVRKVLAARSASRKIQEIAQKEATKKACITTANADSDNTDITHDKKKPGTLLELKVVKDANLKKREARNQGLDLAVVKLFLDGGTSRGKEAFWTMHISTEERKVYFIEAKEATRESHTAEWIKNWVVEIADQIGRERFCCIVCDSTGNTRLSRKIAVETIVTMFNLPDICHHFSNTIKDIVRIEHFKTDFDEYFKEFARGRLSQAASKFVATLGQLIDIGKPLLRALTFLESNEATPGDVFVFWHATLQAIDHILNDPNQEIPFEARIEIIGILNHRHDQILGQGNLSDSADLYLSGAYLHPLYLDSDFFKHESLVLDPNAKVDYTGISFPSTFKRVALFISGVGVKEIRHGKRPQLTKWNGAGQQFRERLLYELQRYGRRQYPYNQPYTEEQGISGWWRAIEGQESATILPQRKHSNSRPSSAFEAKATSIHHNAEFPIDDVSDKWLDEPLEPVESAVELDVMLPDYPVNMKSKSLETVFEGRKMANEKKKVSVKPEQPEVQVRPGEEDEDDDYLLIL